MILRHFWVVGTDTDVGKTFVTTLLMRYFQRQGCRVAPYKPIQTGEIERDGKRYYSDTMSYLQFSLHTLTQTLNTYSFSLAASPHYAAEIEGKCIQEELILQTIEKLKKQYDGIICEGAGGLYVPLHSDTTFTLLDVIQQSNLPVVLVAHTKLGTINHTLLSIEALKVRGIEVLGIVFNQFGRTALERNNVETVRRFVTDIPFFMVEANRTIESYDDEDVFEGLMTYEI